MDSIYFEHLLEPRNYGSMENCDAKGVGKNQLTKEMVVIELKIDEKTQKITDIKWQTNGCSTTVVSGSLFSTEYKKGTLKNGIDFTNQVLEKIKDNPPQDAACGEIVARAFLAAVKDYFDRKMYDEIMEKLELDKNNIQIVKMQNPESIVE